MITTIMPKWIQYFKEGIWLKTLDPRKPIRSLLMRIGRVCFGAIEGFLHDQCGVKAASLTFYTLLSIVPILAIAFGIAKGFGFETHLKSQVLRQFEENSEIAERVVAFSYSLLDHAEGGIIAGIGALFLLWSALRLLNGVESAFNAIWKVPYPRSTLRQFSDYLAILIICPILIVISSSLTIYISAELRSLTQVAYIGDVISPAIYLTFRLIPVFISWLVLTLIYLLMPNTRVPFIAALIAGIAAGSAYQAIQWGYIYFQVGVSSYGAIYGSFAAIPLFMLWIHISWLVVLAGAEIAYRIDCERTIGTSGAARKMISPRILGVLLMQRCATNLSKHKGDTSLISIAREYGVAIDSLRHVAADLTRAQLLTPTSNGWHEATFLPSRPIHEITVADITRALDRSHDREVSIIASHAVLSVEKSLQSWDTQSEETPGNVAINEVLL